MSQDARLLNLGEEFHVSRFMGNLGWQRGIRGGEKRKRRRRRHVGVMIFCSPPLLFFLASSGEGEEKRREGEREGRFFISYSHHTFFALRRRRRRGKGGSGSKNSRKCNPSSPRIRQTRRGELPKSAAVKIFPYPRRGEGEKIAATCKVCISRREEFVRVTRKCLAVGIS